jgi:hypothetical protein
VKNRKPEAHKRKTYAVNTGEDDFIRDRGICFENKARLLRFCGSRKRHFMFQYEIVGWALTFSEIPLIMPDLM